nr:hypothetical transcript [Hymenolepis microstoma]
MSRRNDDCTASKTGYVICRTVPVSPKPLASGCGVSGSLTSTELLSKEVAPSKPEAKEVTKVKLFQRRVRRLLVSWRFSGSLRKELADPAESLHNLVCYNASVTTAYVTQLTQDTSSNNYLSA